MLPWFMWFIIFWSSFLVLFMAIGGFFMFRKFLKSMPKQDGVSELDWQDYYIEMTRELWSHEALELLEELVKPVPELFRDVARKSIAGKIGKLAAEEKAQEITQDLMIKGYIMATPARDHKKLKQHLDEKEIDYSHYRHLLQ